MHKPIKFVARRLGEIFVASFLLCLLPALAGAQGIPSTLGWYEIPNTRLRAFCPDPASYPQIQGIEGCSAVVEDWSGGAFDTVNNRLLILGGGHGGYAGNEVYALNMNTLTMSRLNTPSTSIRDGCGSGGTYADGKPVSRHTYNHLAYLPTQNAVFMYGGALWQCGAMAEDTWLFNLSTLTWTSKSTVSTGNVFAVGAAYDPVNALVYIRDDWTLRSYNPITNTWTTRSTQSAPFGGGYKHSVIDPVRRRYYITSDNTGTTLYWYDITSPTGNSMLSSAATTGCSGFLGDYEAAMEYDPIQDRIVGWNGGNTVYILNPDTLNCTTVTYSGGPTKLANGTFGRFRYVPSLNLFVVCNSIDANCYTLRLTSGTTPPPPAAPTVALSASPTSIASGSTSTLTWSSSNATSCTASGGWSGTKATSGSQVSSSLATNTTFTLTCIGTGGSASQSATVTVTASAPPPTGGTSADTDFQARCSAPGVVKCVGFDNASDFTQPAYPNDGPYAPGGGTLAHLTRDTSIKASGGGSARFEVVSSTGENPSGSWVVSYPTIGEGQTLYVQVRQRFDTNMLNNKNLFGGGGWKQIIMHSLEAGSCALLEITMNNYKYRGFPYMYSDCGGQTFDIFSSQANDYIVEYSQPYPPSNPGTVGTDYWCVYNKVLQGDTTNRCAFYKPDQWMTFYYEIHVGTWGQANSTVRAWVGFEGQPLQLVVNHTQYKINKESSAPGFNRLTLTNYDTGRCIVASCVHPTAYTWYDELIVSTQPIAAPAGSQSPPTATQPPAPPTNLTVK